MAGGSLTFWRQPTRWVASHAALDGREPGELVFAALPPDRHGKVGSVVARAAIDGQARVVVIEGPRAAEWERVRGVFEGAGWHVFEGELVTTEFGCGSTASVCCGLRTL